MITREQVQDLRAGDVVEIRDDRSPLVMVRGPLAEQNGTLIIGHYFTIRWATGDVPPAHEHRILTVIERAPRPLYVNHDRTEPAPGDVVRDDTGTTAVWMFIGHGWRSKSGASDLDRVNLPDRLRLLVDGETGQAVP